MPYDHHITRREHWSDEGMDITLEEWVTYVKNNPEFRFNTIPFPNVYSDPVLPDGSGSGKWDADFIPSNGLCEGYLGYWDGRLYTSRATTEFLKKMWKVAQHFSARVLGDDDEEYDSEGNIIDDSPK